MPPNDFQKTAPAKAMAVTTMTGGQAVVECLRREGVRHVFNVPGESFLDVLDKLYDAPEIQLITNRQEGGACYMAEAYAKATRGVGVCIVTRGPGATNASIGVHCAAQDSTPLVLLVGQVPRVNRGREAFQEIDYGRFFGSLAKWVVEADSAVKLPEIITRAFHTARSGRPGPVVVSLPEDVLTERAEMRFPEPVPLAVPHPDPVLIAEMAARIDRAERPVLLLGGGVQYARGREAAVRFAERFQVPVLTSWRRNDAFPNDHPHYAGNLALGKTPAAKLAREADLVVVVGTRLSEITTGDYTFPLPGQRMIQVDIEPSVIGRHHVPEIAIVSDARLALEAALEVPREGGGSGENGGLKRREWIQAVHAEHEAFVKPTPRHAETVSMESVMETLEATLPEDAILTVDAGNASAWVQRFRIYRTEDSLLGPTVGSMGYGLPAAIAAKLAHPGRVVVGTCGDGAFLMTGQELATAVQYEVGIVMLVFNNSMYGTIRAHQERHHPGRTIGTDMVNPNFAELARAYGAEGIRVETTADFKPALERALKVTQNEGRPAVLDVLTDKENISIGTTLTDLRAAASR